MDELKDVSIHHTALRILSEITALKDYDATVYKTVQVFFMEYIRYKPSSFFDDFLINNLRNWFVHRMWIKTI